MSESPRNQGFILAALLRLTLLGIVLIQVTFLATRYAFRVDLTSDQLYTLTSSTEKVLDSLNDKLVIEAYFSPDDSLPITYRPLRVMMRNTLQEYVELGEGKVTVQYFNPFEDRTVRETAERLGIQPQQARSSSSGQLTATEIWQGIRVRYGAEKQEVIPLVQFGSTYNYEAVLTPLIKRLTVKERPVIGVLAFRSQPGGGAMEISMEERTKPQGYSEILKEHSRDYDFRGIDVRKGALIPEEIKVVLLIRPKRMTDRMKFIFDQFLMRGGKLVVFADSVEVEVRASREFRGKVPPLDGPADKTKFLDWLRGYGVAMEERIVAEGVMQLYQRYGTPTQENQLHPFMYPYMFQAANKDWSQEAGQFARGPDGTVNEPLRKQLERLFKPGVNLEHDLMQTVADRALPGLFWPCPVGLMEPMPQGLDGKVLMRTSPLSWRDIASIELDPFVGAQDPKQRMSNLKRWSVSKANMRPVRNPVQTPLMVHVTGQFTSFFKDREIPPREAAKAAAPKKGPEDWGDEPVKKDGKQGPTPPKKKVEDTTPKEEKLVQSAPGASLVVLGDATFIRDDFFRALYAPMNERNGVVGPSGHGFGRIASVFFRNLLDWLLQERDLLALINKKGTDRSMTFVEQNEATGETLEEFQERLSDQLFWVRLMNALGPAFVLAGLGFVLWMVRSTRKRAFLSQFKTYQPSTKGAS